MEDAMTKHLLREAIIMHNVCLTDTPILTANLKGENTAVKGRRLPSSPYLENTLHIHVCN